MAHMSPVSPDARPSKIVYVGVMLVSMLISGGITVILSDHVLYGIPAGLARVILGPLIMMVVLSAVWILIYSKFKQLEFSKVVPWIWAIVSLVLIREYVYKTRDANWGLDSLWFNSGMLVDNSLSVLMTIIGAAGFVMIVDRYFKTKKPDQY